LLELSSYYRRSEERYQTSQYLLYISEDETTTVSLDGPPQEFDSLLSTPVRYLSLRIHTADPKRDIEFTLYHGSDAIQNSIRLHSDDEDWVNIAYVKVSKLLNNTEAQSTFFPRFGAWLIFPLALIVGWPLKNLFMWILLLLGEAKLVAWSVGLFVQHLLFAGVLGFVPAMLLVGYAVKAYPSVEIQTGPKRNWHAARRRARLRLVLGLAISAPGANFLYDIYKLLFLH
jgi:hypothetical protein